MASRPRRGVAAAVVKKDEEKKKEDVEDEEENDTNEVQIVEEDDDDGPPPVLEREASCGENDDTDGEAKEEDNASSTTSPTDLKGSQDDIETESKDLNLMQALSSIFTADSDSSKKRRSNANDETNMFLNNPISIRTPISKSLLLNKTSVSATQPTRFAAMRMSSLAGTSSSAGNRKYGIPPPIPHALRNIAAAIQSAPSVGVGSNTSLGPARLLEHRKRPMFNRESEGIAKRAPSTLVSYNGGRAGEKFKKFSNLPTSASADSSNGTSVTSSSIGVIDVQSMLRDQSPVKMQVLVGGDHDHSNGESLQEALEMAALQKEKISSIAKNSTNHSILLCSMTLNGLNTLRSRSNDEYSRFAGDLFSLFSKYNIN